MNLSPLPIQKFFANNGRPLSGGLLFTYVSGTTTKIATYQDQAGTVNTNPVVLDFRGEANVWLDQTLTYKFVLAPAGDTDPPTKPIWTVDNISAAVTFASLTAQIIGQIIYPRTAAEIAAGVTPVNYAYPSGDVRRYGATMDGVTDDTTALENAILVGSTNQTGICVLIPIGTLLVTRMVFLPNRVRLLGSCPRGSIIKASASWAVGHGAAAWSSVTAYVAENMVTSVGVLYIAKQANTNQAPPNATYWTPISNAMFYGQNGYTAGVGKAMFDSVIENLTIHASGVSGLGCILSSAWQENCGTRRCTLQGFMTYGIRFQDGFGGVSYCRIQDTEIFAHASNTTGTCITVAALSISRSFKVHLLGVVLSGGGVANLAGGYVSAESSLIEGSHGEGVTSLFSFSGGGSHAMLTCTGSGTGPVTSLVQLASDFDGGLTMINCMRNASTNFLKDDRATGWGTLTYDIYNFHISPGSLPVLPVCSVGGNWCGGSFDGTAGTVVLGDGFNVTSITDNGTGDYTITMSHALRNATAGAPWAQVNRSNTWVQVLQLTASTFQIITRDSAGVAVDVSGVVFGCVRLS